MRLLFGLVAWVAVLGVPDAAGEVETRSSSAAAEGAPAGLSEFATLDELVKALPRCISVSDQCTICAIDEARRDCSVIGFACLKRNWVCTAFR